MYQINDKYLTKFIDQFTFTIHCNCISNSKIKAICNTYFIEYTTSLHWSLYGDLILSEKTHKRTQQKATQKPNKASVRAAAAIMD